MLPFAQGRILLVIALSLFIGLALITPTKGQQRVNIPVFCMPVDVVDKIAREKLKEYPTHRAEGPNGYIYAMYENPHTKAFSFIAIAADGMACVLASGKNWKMFKDSSSDL